MLFSFNFYSSLLLVVISNGFLYSLLLFVRAVRQGEKPKHWLGLFTVLCMLYIMPWMLGFAGWYDDPGYRDLIFYIPFTNTFFIGPIFYFYVQSLLNPAFRPDRINIIHLVPGILYLAYNIIVVVADKVMLDEVYFLARGSDLEFDTWYKTGGWLSMATYFILSAKYYFSFKRVMANTVSFADSLLFRWLKNALLAFVVMLIIQLAFALAFIAFPQYENYKTNWWFYFSFGIIAIYVAVNGYNSKSAGLQPYRLENDAFVLLAETESNQPNHIPLDDTTNSFLENIPSVEWKLAIQGYMDKGGFKDPELTLPLLAKDLSSNSSTISRAINHYFGLNFNDYVNSLRVAAVKSALNDQLHRRQTLLAIALANGFNSKATFNRAFRKHTGLTPSEYIKTDDFTLK